MCCEFLLLYFRYLFQMGAWISLILEIVINKGETGFVLILFLSFYFGYLLFAFLSPNWRFLCKCKKNSTINEKFEEIIKATPKITWNIISYHNEAQYNIKRNNAGVTEQNASNLKIITHSASGNMTFYSSRDISGPLKIDCENLNINKLSEIDLVLTNEIILCDDFTKADYENKKKAFIFENKKDELYEITEKMEIQGLDTSYKVRVYDITSCGVISYFLFTIFGLGESFSCCYFGNRCCQACDRIDNNHRICYNIKKAVSNRESLNQPRYNTIYEQSNPKIDLISKQYIYEPSEFIIDDPNYNICIPSSLPLKEEIETININKNKMTLEPIKYDKEHVDSAPALGPFVFEKSTERLNLENNKKI